MTRLPLLLAVLCAGVAYGEPTYIVAESSGTYICREGFLEGALSTKEYLLCLDIAEALNAVHERRTNIPFEITPCQKDCISNGSDSTVTFPVRYPQ